MNLHPFQQTALDRVKAWLATPAPRLLIAAPTGTGKSYMEVEALRLVPNAHLITPSMDIASGILAKLGVDVEGLGETGLAKAATRHNVFTPVTYRNRLLAGDLEPPALLIVDEVHHHNAETYRQVDTLTDTRTLGFTATPYRGTAKGTAEFRLRWGEPYWAITYPDAVSQGYLHCPEVRTVPLLDDEVIEVSNGEFQVSSVEAETKSRLVELANLIRSYPLDRPTMAALPTRTIVAELLAILGPESAVAITGDSTREERRDAYAKCLASTHVLLQINVVGEGVDLRVRRLFDALPTMSPVRWVQLFGRATRPVGPGEASSEYICTNRNLLRHCYALQGVLPTQVIAEAQNLFPPGSRSGYRAFGLEGLGRFKANPVPLKNGLQGECYLLANSDGKVTTEYACILHPLYPEPLWATRQNYTGSYGTWCRCDSPEGFRGFTSKPGSTVSEKQKSWWTKAAGRYGLDPEAEVNRRSFAVLPVLSHLSLSLDNS
jgi:superfamily II DNA or RNA helicase